MVEIANDIWADGPGPTPYEPPKADIREWGTDKEDRLGVAETTIVALDGRLDTIEGRRLTANRTYYVRTDGSNSNDGLANTSGGAFLTIQKAIDVCAALDLGGFDITIAAAAGTFTTPVVVSKPFIGNGTVTLSGPTTAIISTTSNNALVVSANTNGKFVVSGCKWQTTTSGSCILNTGGGRLPIGGMEFGACAGSHIHSTYAGSWIDIVANYTITGGAIAHVDAFGGGQVVASGRTATLTGTPAFTSFAKADSLGYVRFVSTTITGSATGQRYNASLNGIIDTSGGGASYFPGNSSGATATGGQYA